MNQIIDSDWLVSQVERLTSEVSILSPSEWAERFRYLTAGVAQRSGKYSFDITPYAREIVDCMDIRSPVREITVMKGVQLGLTTAMENAIGYFISEVKSAPMMFLTASDVLAKKRMDLHLVPMIENSGLSDRIRANESLSNRRQGRTTGRVEIRGGGHCVVGGINSPSNVISLPAQVLVLDELDAWKLDASGAGDVLDIVEKRTSGFTNSRKIFRASTPLEKATSLIYRKYIEGDRRKYFVPCKRCGHLQELLMRKLHEDTGEIYGLWWDMDGDRVLTDTVRYHCIQCQEPHKNMDKKVMLLDGCWRPTGAPVASWNRSYHISSLYAPASMFSWEQVAIQWCAAYDVAQERPKDIDKLRVFYNNIRGKPFELRGKKLDIATVSKHRRAEYRLGEVPNEYMREVAEGPAGLLITTVDVQGASLHVSVWAFTRGQRRFLIDYEEYQGDPADLGDVTTWRRLKDFIKTKVYVADDGRRYPLRITLIDSGNQPSVVTSFSEEFNFGADGFVVMPIKGASGESVDKWVQPFRPTRMKTGQVCMTIAVSQYKDRLSSTLEQEWSGVGVMPENHFSAPAQISDAKLRELTVEKRVLRVDKATGRKLGFKWICPSGARNELWDLSVYAWAGLHMVCSNLCIDQMGLPAQNFDVFWDYCENHAAYWLPPVDQG